LPGIPALHQDLFRDGVVEFEIEGDPFRTAGRQPKPKVKVAVLYDATEEFFKAILTSITDGQIKWRNVPFLGDPGSSKTTRALYVGWRIGEHYGWENVNIVMSDDLMALAAGMRPVKVNVLIVDDALRKYQSRGGTTKELKEAIGKFTELRHELEDILSGKASEAGKTMGHIDMSETGVVFCLFTAQLYKGLDKTFRNGITVFCSPLVEDKETIMSLFTNKCAEACAPQRAREAWGYLEKKFYAVDVEDNNEEREWAIAVLPMIGPAIIRTAYYKGICMNCKEERQQRKKPCKKCGKIVSGWEPQSINPKTKRPYVQKVVAPPDETRNERLARLTKAYDYLANLFIEAGHDPNEAGAVKLLRVFIRERCASIAAGETSDTVLRSTDWVEIERRPMPVLEHAVKLRRQRAQEELQENAARESTQGGIVQAGASDDELIDSTALMVREYFELKDINLLDQRAKAYLRDFLRKRFADSPSLRARILKLREDIYATALAGPGGDEGQEKAPAKAAAPVPRAHVPLGMQFTFEVLQELPRLIDRQVEREVRKGMDRAKARVKWEQRILLYKVNVRDGMGQSHIQRDWRRWFGPEALRPFSNVPWGEDALVEKVEDVTGEPRPPLTQKSFSNWKLAVESALGDMMGEAYEEWVTNMLQAGWRPAWARAARILQVERDGGQGHDPDVKVTYDDGGVDWLSLKVYAGREYPNLAIMPAGNRAKVDVRPERDAFLRALRQDPEHEHRLVIMVRDIDVRGMEVWVAYDATTPLPEQVKFNRGMVGTSMANQWTPPHVGGPSTLHEATALPAAGRAEEDDVVEAGADEAPDEDVDAEDEESSDDDEDDDDGAESLDDAYERSRPRSRGGEL